MANKKISDIAAATTPLAGTELALLESASGASGRCTTQDIADLAKAYSVQTTTTASAVTPEASNDKVVISA